MLSDNVLKKRFQDYKTLTDKVKNKHWTANSLNYAWEDVIVDILKDKSKTELLQTTNDKDHTFTITLRGTYSLGRNALLKQMFIIDEHSYFLQDTDKKYVFLISPMFKVIIPGFFQEYNNPFNFIDLRGVQEYSISYFLDLIGEIYETPELKGYNFIYDGNKFLGYTNRMKIHAESYGRKEYFDLYILDSKTYDYLNTPLTKCEYDKNGWNKYPKLRREMCPIDDTLLSSIQNDIKTVALLNKSPIDMIISLLYGELLDIKHFRNKPLTLRV